MNPNAATTERQEISPGPLWQQIFGEQRGFLALFSGERADKLNNVQEQYFQWPEAAAEAADQALQSSAAGREVFFCAHLLTEPRRKKEFAAPLVALYADLDHDKLPSNLPSPSFVVESSPGRWQCYWVLSHPLVPKRAEELNKRLTDALNADPGGYDLTQVLRVPGTVNHKYAERFQVRILNQHTGVYDPGDLDRLLPALPAVPQVAGPGMDGPPVRLTDEGLKVWRGEIVVRKETGEVDRSESLYRIACVLYEAGASRPTILVALAERDQTLDWKKYTDRPSEYERIADKIAGKQRLEPQRLAEVRRWRNPPHLPLTELPALLREFVEIIQPTVPGLSADWPILAFLTAYSSCLTQLRYRNLRPNLHFMGLGAPATGKSLVLSAVKRVALRVAEQAGLPVRLVTSGSTEGLLKSVEDEGSVALVVYDEYAAVAKAIRKRDYLANHKEALNFLYDGEPLRHQLRNEKHSFVTRGRSVVLAATNQPSFAAHSEREDMVNGYLSRFLICASDPTTTQMHSGPDEDAVLAFADRLAMHYEHVRDVKYVSFGKWWSQMEDGEPHDETTQSSGWDEMIDFSTVEMGWLLVEDRKARLNRTRPRIVSLDDLSREDDSKTTIGRTIVHAIKLAIVLEALEAEPRVLTFSSVDKLPFGAKVGDTYLAVRDHNIDLGFTLATRCRNYAGRALKWLASTEDEQMRDAVLRALTRHPEGMTTSELLAATHAPGVVWLNRVLAMMEESGEISNIATHGGRGRPGKKWVLRKFAREGALA